MTTAPSRPPPARRARPQASICAFVPYPVGTAPSQRYRIEQWMPALQERGLHVTLVPFAGPGLMRWLHRPGHWVKKSAAMAGAFLRSAARVAGSVRYDAVLIHRTICLAGPAVLERAAAALGRPLVFDFDDAIYLLHTSGGNRALGWLKFPGKTGTICRVSRHVVVGNDYLADYARQFNPHVSVVPSSVDIERYCPRPRGRQTRRAVVGWSGSGTSQTYLEMFVPLLRRIVTELDVELRIHSDRPPELGDVPCVWRPWRAETEVEELSQFDVGIMPMPPTAWARGKCAMKALLYMALGMPTVSSAVGMNLELIEDGVNGCLAATDDEWLTKLERLVRDPETRARLGHAGRETVERGYSTNHAAALFATAVEQVLA